jgi:hypothetical protein
MMVSAQYNACAMALAGVLVLLVPAALRAQQSGKVKVPPPGPSDVAPNERVALPTPRKPTDFKSAHFLIHTDLKSKDAHDLLNRLEVMLGLISKYWGHPPVGTIECYVVKDLTAWPEGSLPAEGYAKIRQGAGVTVVETLHQGSKTVAAKAIVYAKYGADPLAGGGVAADRGTPQHEAVHAYCGQAFGHTGPLWYAEGMAEMGRYWRQGDTSVNCDPIVVDYIRSQSPKPLAEIVADQNSNGKSDSWQNYAWRWALCHMLENNPNYSARFRALGLGFLAGQPVSFAESFAPMRSEAAFEYRFFLKHLDQGYRVDLCSWDWKRKFKEPSGGTSVSSRITANRGWQPSGVTVVEGRQYDYSSSGAWQTGKDSNETSADGQRDGTGKLDAVVMKDFGLTAPFPLGAYGSFSAPSDGQLYLRCRDAWNELADNRGSMSVKIKLSGGTTLPRPGRTLEAASETTARAD